jgi:hypothetical protein
LTQKKTEVKVKKITILGNTGNACCRDACHSNGLVLETVVYPSPGSIANANAGADKIHATLPLVKLKIG